MPRLYETKVEQQARELRALYAGVDPAPATFPPKSAPKRSRTRFDPVYVTNQDLIAFPRYQTVEAQARKTANQTIRMVRHFRRVTGGFTGT